MIYQRRVVPQFVRLITDDDTELDALLFNDLQNLACFSYLVIVDNGKNAAVMVLQLVYKRLFLFYLDKVQTEFFIQLCGPFRAQCHWADNESVMEFSSGFQFQHYMTCFNGLTKTNLVCNQQSPVV